MLESVTESLCRAFTETTLPKSEWTHRSHLTVGTWHVWNFGKVEALRRMRDGIRRLNEAHGVPNSESRGYHETITCCFITLLDEFVARLPPGTTFEETVAQLTAGVLMDKDCLLSFYSRDLLMSARARLAYVAPDLAPVRLNALNSRY